MEGDTWHATARPATPGERDEIWERPRGVPRLKKYEARAGERQMRRSSSAGIEARTGSHLPALFVAVRPSQRPGFGPTVRVRLRMPSSTGMPSPGPVARPRFRWVHSRMCSEFERLVRDEQHETVTVLGHRGTSSSPRGTNKSPRAVIPRVGPQGAA